MINLEHHLLVLVVRGTEIIHENVEMQLYAVMCFIYGFIVLLYHNLYPLIKY